MEDRAYMKQSGRYWLPIQVNYSENSTEFSELRIDDRLATSEYPAKLAGCNKTGWVFPQRDTHPAFMDNV